MFSNPFAPLELPREARAQLRDLADLFVARAVAHYEQYLIKDTRHLDVVQWKCLKQRDDVCVYSERARHRATNDSQSESEDDDVVQSPGDSTPTPTPSRDRTDIPVMLTVGTLSGDLYDVMYGVVCPTLDMMRIKMSYVQDGVVDAAVLATLQEPTPQDPFQSLSVKWVIKGQPLHIRSLSKNRDLVYLDATGFTRLPSTGELVGYHLLHSVHFPETHDLPTCQRGNLSICGLFRQRDKAHVEVYARGFFTPTGRIMRALVIKSASDVMLSIGRISVCAHMKKFAYALRRRHAPTLGNTTLDERLRLRRTTSTTKPSCCAVCSQGLSSLAVLTFGKKSKGTQCRLCLQHVCAKCTIVQKLSAIFPPNHQLDQKTVSFCLLCVTAVTSASALAIAEDEVAQQDAPLGYGRSSLASSLSSPSSSTSEPF